MNWGLLILLLYGAFHVLTWALQNAAKSREQKKARELAQMRQRQQAQQGPMRQQAPAPVQIGDARSRREQLAARRQEQLEQLRRRREKPAGAPAQRQSTSPAPTQVQRPQRAPRPQTAIPDLPPGLRQWQQQQQTKATAETAQRASNKLQVDAIGNRDAAMKSVALEKKRAVSATRKAAHSAELARVVASRRSVRADRLRDLLSDRQAVAEFFLLKEILDRPLALRSPQSSESFD